MGNKTEIWQGTLALMLLKTIEMLGPLHGYGIARRIEQTSGDRLSLNYGTLYPCLLKLEQEGWIVSEWGVSENNRKAKFYKLTRAGRRQLARETREWDQTTAILAKFLAPTRMLNRVGLAQGEFLERGEILLPRFDGRAYAAVPGRITIFHQFGKASIGPNRCRDL